MFHPKTEYTFILNAHGKLSRIDHKLGLKKCLSKFNKIEIILAVFFDTHHSGTKSEINYKKKTGKITKMWRLKSILLNNQWVNKRNQRRKKYFVTNENKNNFLWDAATVFLRVKFVEVLDYLKKQENVNLIFLST